MTEALSRCWHGATHAPWVLAELAVRYCKTAAILALVSWWWFGEAHTSVLITVLIVMTILAAMGNAPNSALSVIQTARFVYRRTIIWLTWKSSMNRAKLYEVQQIEDAMHSARSTPGGRKHPRLKRWGRCRIRRTATGMVLTVDGSTIGAGHTAFGGDQAIVLRSRWKALNYEVFPHPRWEWLTCLRLIYVDPFRALIRPGDLCASPSPGLVVVGKDSELQPVIKNLMFTHLLIGASRSGKSSEVWLILRALLQQKIPFRLRLSDPKGGMEFYNLKGKAYVYEADILKCKSFLEDALRALSARQAEMMKAGVRKWVPGDERWPLDVMVIDELVTFLSMLNTEKISVNGKQVKAMDAFKVYLTQILAAGFTVVACSQIVQKETLGVIRQLFTYVTCLRVGSKEEVEIAVGDPKTYPAHEIPVGDEYAGIGYQATDVGPVKYRSAFVTDAERDEIAEGVAVWSQKYRALDKPTKKDPILLDLDIEADEDELVMNGSAA